MSWEFKTASNLRTNSLSRKTEVVFVCKEDLYQFSVMRVLVEDVVETSCSLQTVEQAASALTAAANTPTTTELVRRTDGLEKIWRALDEAAAR